MGNPYVLGYHRHYDILYRRAVDYSSGLLVDITIEIFATDDLLRHIAVSAMHLRRLRLVRCYSLSDEGMCEFAKKLSQLEEVDISMGNLSEDCIEAIGQSWHQLKSFKFNKSWHQLFRHPHIKCDDGAFAITKTMPRLRQLQLIGNKLTNGGLLAILDGCPHLESLDLRHCINLNMGESLGKRCAEQIKNLRLPDDSITDEDDDGFPDYYDGVNDISDSERGFLDYYTL